MSYQPAQSPWETANNPPDPIYEHWGEILINAWFCMLVPGQGKVPFDEKTLDAKTGKPPRRYTAIDLSITPLPESGDQYDINRTMLAEFGEWKDITWPSLRDLGVMDAASLNGKFARMQLVPTGRKYTNSNGEEREATAAKFAGIFDTREQCLADMNGSEAPAKDELAGNGNQAPSGNGNGNERDTALKFAKVYVQNAVRSASGDLDKAREKLGPMLAQQKLIAQFFTVDSPEIVDLMATELTK